jgi:hypothetical protein
VSFLALHSAVTDWVAILQISQSLSGSTLGDQHWCQQCSFASGCVPSVRQAGNLTLWSMTSLGLQEWSVFAQLHLLLFSVLIFLEACGLGTHIGAYIITHFAKSDGPGVGGGGGGGTRIVHRIDSCHHR